MSDLLSNSQNRMMASFGRLLLTYVRQGRPAMHISRLERMIDHSIEGWGTQLAKQERPGAFPILGMAHTGFTMHRLHDASAAAMRKAVDGR